MRSKSKGKDTSKIKVPVTAEGLKAFVEEQLAVINEPLSLKKSLQGKICQRTGLSKKDWYRVEKSLTAHLHKKYKNTYFTQQSKVEIVNQIIKLERKRELERQQAFLSANEMLLIFNHNMLPDLNGNINNKTLDDHEVVLISDEDEDEDEEGDEEGKEGDDNEEEGYDNEEKEDANKEYQGSKKSRKRKLKESTEVYDKYGIDNVNINRGLTFMKLNEIIDLVEEFPESNCFDCSNKKLLRNYNLIRAKLVGRIKALKKERERDETLNRLKARLNKVAYYGNKNLTDAGHNLAGNIDLILRTEFLTNRLARMLEKPEVTKKVQESMFKKLDKI